MGRLKFSIAIFWLAFAVSTALPNSSLAATYYLDALNGNDSNPGTSHAPWQTMAKVQAAAQAGDTVVIQSVQESVFTADWPEGITYQAPGVTQFGITWTFDRNYTIGRFANRDYWVVGPVTILGIDPPSTDIGGRIMHGSMINPSPTLGRSNGYDSIFSSYNSSLNAARPNNQDLSIDNPLVISTGSSLVSTITWRVGEPGCPSLDQGVPRPTLKTAAVLTVLDSPAPSGSFRPPYVSLSKEIRFNKNQLDYSKLASLIAPASTPRLEQQSGDIQSASVERMFERVWLDHTPQYGARFIHPSENMQEYGRDIANQVGKGALMLNLNFTNDEKETLLIRFTQLGIDLYGVVQDGGKDNWIGEGGIYCGRKLPILFAGILLNDQEMKDIGQKSGDYLYSDGYGSGNPPPDYIHFAEDDQTFYVKPADVYTQPYTLKENHFGAGRGTYIGNVKVVQGSNIVEGVGTSWTGLNPAAGPFWFGVVNDVEAYKYDGKGYKVASVDSNTRITLTESYRGETNTTGTLNYIISDGVVYGHGMPFKVQETDGKTDYFEYLDKDLGLPDWGERHSTQPSIDGKNWDSSYRILNSYVWGGIALAGHIIGAKDFWNHDAFFDYLDRYMECHPTRQHSTFVNDMWDMYRLRLGGVWTRNDPNDIYSNGSNPANYDAVPPLQPTNLISTKQTSSSISLSWTAPAQASDGDVALSYKVLRNASMTNLVYATTLQDTGLNADTDYSYQIYSIDDAGNQSATAATGTFCTLPPNQPPVLQTIGNKSVSEGSSSNFTVIASDADGDEITYSVQNLPSGAAFANRTFSWTPGFTQAGNYQVTFIASDGQDQDSEMVTITVNNVNRPPVLGAIGNQSVNENGTLSFSVSATDPDGDAITYSVNGLPSGAVFASQTFTWTPTYNQAGTYQVTFIASDAQAQDSETITVTVNNVNRAPMLSAIGNKSIYTDDLLTFTVDATDPDGDTITYSASNLPSGASFDAGNQTFSWAPNDSQVGSYQVTFIASDGQAQDSESITITVSADTSAPSVTNCSPAADAIQVPLNNLVILHIVDVGKGVDANSVRIQVNGNTVYTGDTVHYSSSNGDCRRTGTKADYGFTYQPNQMFDFEQKITVAVNAADVDGNVMPEYNYSFWTEMRSFGANKKVSSDLDDLSCVTPVTVRESSGNIWVVWHAGLTGSRNIFFAKLADGADSFDPSIQLTDNAADQCNPAVALDGSNNLYIVWQDNRRGNWDIYVATSADNWSTETKITDSNDNETNPAIAIDGGDNAHIVWQDDRAGNQDIYVASSSNDFVTKTVSRVTSDSSDQTEPAIAVDSNNTVYVVWTDLSSSSGDIYGAASNNSWSNVAIVTNANGQSSPVIATEATGSILHLLWVDDSPGDKDIYYAALNGLPTSPLTGNSIIDDSSGADQLEPVIAVTGSTGANLKVFACWQDKRNVSNSSDMDLYFVRANSDSGTNIFVGDDGTNKDQSQPAMGVDRYGHPYMVWTDSRNTNNQVYYAGSGFLDPQPSASKVVSASTRTTVGTDPASITSVDDVSVVVLPGAYSCDVRITISRIKNPPAFAVPCLSGYDFGPSGMVFNQPVTITIPYVVSDSQGSATPYWYNSLSGALSQQGITDIRDIVISPTLHGLSFKTTHFTPFYLLLSGVGAAAASGGGGGGGGGCALSTNGGGSIVEFLLPYIALAGVTLILKLRDARSWKVREPSTRKG